jgi:molecular chaperone DnaJ
VCTTCNGEGTAPGTHPVPCETCRGAGEVAQVQRSFLGEIRTLRPCPACRGFGTLIPDPCRECSGDGRVRARRSLTVKIPAGVDTGTRVQLAGEGEVGAGGGPPGDLYVEVQVSPHEVFTRDGTTLRCVVTVPMTAAALGTTLTLPTLEADTDSGAGSGVETSFDLEVKSGTQSGSEYTFRGRGVPGLRGGRGDLVVTVVVETPTRLDPRQEELMRELAAIRDEEKPDGRLGPLRQPGSVFGRIRDAFNGPPNRH